MYSETTMVAKQCRLREWAAQIRDCQSRPAGMSVVEWCACHDITKANYYYRIRRSPVISSYVPGVITGGLIKPLA